MLTKQDYKAIKSLLRYAKTVIHGLQQREVHFALGVNKKTFVYGTNSYVPKGEFSDIHKYLTPHAESSVLRVMSDIDTLYVLRINRQGELMNSTPCKECRELIVKKKVKNLIYSINGGFVKTKGNER